MATRGHLGPYRVETMLGRGRLGALYKACRDGLERQVVLRVLGAAGSADPEARNAVRVGLRPLARISHPNIAAVYELIEDQDEVLIAQEYVEGTTLETLLSERPGRRMPLSEAMGLFDQVLAALAYAHRQGVIHGGLGPDCVRICDGRVKLVDFAIARLAGIARQTSALAVLGPSPYMSPEQLWSADLDPKSDVYSAAALLYETLSGHLPFEDGPDASPDLRSAVPDLPAGVSESVAIALRRDPQERFETAEDLLRALREGIAGFLPLPPRPAADAEAGAAPAAVVSSPSLQVPEPRWPDRSRSLATASAGLLGLVLISAYGLRSLRDEPLGPQAGGPEVRTEEADVPPQTPTPDLVESTPEPSPPTPAPVPVSTIPKPTVSPIAEPTETPPPTRTPASEVVETGPDPAEVRRQEVERLGEEVRRGLQQVEADFRSERFDLAEEKLDVLMAMAQPFAADLEEEVRDIQGLREKVRDADLAVLQLRKIEHLMEQGRYAEAGSLARDLSSDPGVPATVAVRARELSSQAREEIRKILSEAQQGPTRNEILEPPQP